MYCLRLSAHEIKSGDLVDVTISYSADYDLIQKKLEMFLSGARQAALSDEDEYTAELILRMRSVSEFYAIVKTFSHFYQITVKRVDCIPATDVPFSVMGIDEQYRRVHENG